MGEMMFEHRKVDRNNAIKDAIRRDAVRPHQPGETAFKSILSEDIEWKPYPPFHPRSVSL